MKTLKQLKEAGATSRARKIISDKLKMMEYLRKGIVTKKEEPDMEKAHKELDDVVHDRFGKRSDEK